VALFPAGLRLIAFAISSALPFPFLFSFLSLLIADLFASSSLRCARTDFSLVLVLICSHPFPGLLSGPSIIGRGVFKLLQRLLRVEVIGSPVIFPLPGGKRPRESDFHHGVRLQALPLVLVREVQL